MPFLINVWVNLCRFWGGFGVQVGTHLAPDGTKTWPKNQSNKVSFLLQRLRIYFELILKFNLGIKGGGGGSNSGCVRCFFGSWGFFEAKMVPRSSRAASKADSGASSIVFNEILVGGFSLQLWCVGLLVCWSCGAIAWLVCLIFGCWVFLFQARWRAKPLAIGYHFVSRTQYINLYIYMYTMGSGSINQMISKLCVLRSWLIPPGTTPRIESPNCCNDSWVASPLLKNHKMTLPRNIYKVFYRYLGKTGTSKNIEGA